MEQRPHQPPRKPLAFNQIVVSVSLALSLLSGIFGIGYSLITKVDKPKANVATNETKKPQDSAAPLPKPKIKASTQARTSNTPATGLSPEPLGTTNLIAAKHTKPVKKKNKPIVGDGIADTPEEIEARRSWIERYNRDLEKQYPQLRQEDYDEGKTQK